MFELLTTAAGGGLFGVIGGLFKQGIDAWQRKKQAELDLEVLKEKNRHESEITDKQTEQLKLEAANAITLSELNKSKEIDIAQLGAIQTALSTDRASYATGEQSKNSGWFVAVDVVRGLIRPGLTLILTTMIIVLSFWMWSNIPTNMLTDPDFLKQTFYRLIDATIYLSTTALGFWFGARGVDIKR